MTSYPDHTSASVWLERWDRARWRRRWKTPILPIPEHIDTIGKLQRATKISGPEARRVRTIGLLNLTQAENVAEHEAKHPTEIWGRLWTDIATLEDCIERDALRLKRFALTWKEAA